MKYQVLAVLGLVTLAVVVQGQSSNNQLLANLKKTLNRITQNFRRRFGSFKVTIRDGRIRLTRSKNLPAGIPKKQATKKGKPTNKQPSRKSGSKQLTKNTLNRMRSEFVNEYKKDSQMMIEMVQLSFHSCVGPNGCDGCINLSDRSNKGVLDTYSKVRRMHKKWEAVVSLADYLIIGSIEAVETAVANERTECNGPCRINIPFKSGRKTCANPGRGNSIALPKGADVRSPHRFLMGGMGMNEEEMVALMGAHSLGGAHRNISGFHGDWDFSRTKLNHGYYQALVGFKDYQPEFVRQAGANQWTAQQSQLMMLHCDMGLARDFTAKGARKTPSCTSDCPNSRTHGIVTRFSRSNVAFINAFAKAFEKMVNLGKFDPARTKRFN